MAALGALGTALLLVCFGWNQLALGRPLAEGIGPLVASWALATALYFAAVRHVLRGRAEGPDTLLVILVFAAAFRVVLIFAPPLLETDPERYLWDGAVSVSGVNPYRWAPREVFDFGRAELIPRDATAARELVRLHGLSEDPRLRPHFLWINHPTVPTIYPPVAQLAFALAARVAPGEVMVLKALVVLVDLGVLALVVGLLGDLGRPRSLALLYGWCPLVLKEYANTGHYDPLAALFLLASLRCLVRGWRAAAGALAGAALLSKLYPVVAVLVLWRRYGARGLAALALAAALLAAPFASAGARSLEGLMVFSISWMRNASVYALAQSALAPLDADPPVVPLPPALTGHAGRDAVGVALDSFVAAKLAMALLLLAGLAWISRWREDDPPAVCVKAYAAVALAFLVSPVQNPWYLGWVLPLAALRGHVAWSVLAGTMVTYYAYHTDESHLRALGGVVVDLRIVEYAPFFLIFALELAPARRLAPALAAMVALLLAGPAPAATLSGRVVLAGEVPALPPLRVNSDTTACGEGARPQEALLLDGERGVKNCVVVVDAPGEAPPRPPRVLDQQACAFVPHVLTVRTGEELVLRNSDPTYHNVHAFGEGMADAFNVGLPRAGAEVRQKLSNPGRFTIRCDAGHRWMRAYVHVVASPHDAVSGSDGRFRIDGLPPGRHTVRLWHELAGEGSAAVEVPASGVELRVTARVLPRRGFEVEMETPPDVPRLPAGRLAAGSATVSYASNGDPALVAQIDGASLAPGQSLDLTLATSAPTQLRLYSIPERGEARYRYVVLTRSRPSVRLKLAYDAFDPDPQVASVRGRVPPGGALVILDCPGFMRRALDNELSIGPCRISTDACALPPELSASRAQVTDPLLDRVLGGWIGKAAGCRLGMPYEGRLEPRWDARAALERGYPDPAVHGFGPDDDSTLSLVNLLAFEAHGDRLAPDDLLSAWREGVAYELLWKTGRRALEERARGVPALACGGGPQGRSLCGRIRADVWGMLAPGDPDRALALVGCDAPLTNRDDGLESARFFAVAASLALASSTPREVVPRTLARMRAEPGGKESRYLDLIEHTSRAPERGLSVQEAREELETRTLAGFRASDPDHAWVHAAPNDALVVLALTYGGGDFARTVALAACLGWDTDCNAGTAGCLLGLVAGASSIPAAFRTPLGNRLRAGIPGREHWSLGRIAELVRALQNAGQRRRPSEVQHERGESGSPSSQDPHRGR